MKSLFVLLMIFVALVLTPALLNAQTDQTTTANLPLSQPLVREGTLAVELADTFKLGTPMSEAEAESMLSAAGISPRNGWIADYPVTPDIIGELETAVGEAAGSGRLAIGKEAALKKFQSVIAGYNLSVKADSSGQGSGRTSAPNYPDSTVINNYYYDEGPPVVTYYAPPPYYGYLYTWVPYPFWGWDFWFPGFFVLADFNVRVHGHHHDHGHGHGGYGEFVSNHFRDFRTGRMSRIDAANRVHGGTFSDRVGTGWSSASARRGAQAILNNSRNVAMAGRKGTSVSPSGSGRGSGPYSRNSTFVSSPRARGTMPSAPAGRAYSSSRSYGGRTFSQPSYRTPRISGPSSTESRSLSAPSGGGRVFNSGGDGRGSFTGGSRGYFGGGARR
jgi:hypothetical protein